MCKLHGVQMFVMFTKWKTALPEAHRIDTSKQEHSNIRMSVFVHRTLKNSLLEREEDSLEPVLHLLVARVSVRRTERVGA